MFVFTSTPNVFSAARSRQRRGDVSARERKRSATERAVE